MLFLDNAKKPFVVLNDVLHNGTFYLVILLQPQIRFWTEFVVRSFVWVCANKMRVTLSNLLWKHTSFTCGLIRAWSWEHCQIIRWILFANWIPYNTWARLYQKNLRLERTAKTLLIIHGKEVKGHLMLANDALIFSFQEAGLWMFSLESPFRADSCNWKR